MPSPRADDATSSTTPSIRAADTSQGPQKRFEVREPDGSPKQATPVGAGTVEGELSGPRDTDWLVLLPPSRDSSERHVALRLDSQADTRLTVYVGSPTHLVRQVDNARAGEVEVVSGIVTNQRIWLRVDASPRGRKALRRASARWRLRIEVAPPTPDDEREPNGSIRRAVPLTPMQSRKGRFDTPEDREVLRLDASGPYRLRIEGLPDGTHLALLGAAGRALARWKAGDDGEARYEDLVLSNAAPVFVQITPSGRHGVGAEWHARLEPLGTPVAHAEPDDVSARAHTVDGDSVEGRVSHRGDVDWYRFTVPAGAVVRAEVVPQSRRDSFGLRGLVAGRGVQSVAKSDGAVLEALPVPNEGTVAVAVEAGPEVPLGASYRLRVGYRMPAGEEREPNDDASSATPLPGNVARRGWIGWRGDVDCWHVSPVTSAGSESAPRSLGGAPPSIATIRVDAPANLGLDVWLEPPVNRADRDASTSDENDARSSPDDPGELRRARAAPGATALLTLVQGEHAAVACVQAASSEASSALPYTIRVVGP